MPPYSLSLAPRAPRVCRRCKGVEPLVRFLGLARTLCIGCQAADRARKASVRPASVARRPRRTPGRHPLHLAWVRSLPCAVRAPSCGTRSHAHHVRQGTGGGTGCKPDDRHTVPLCPIHHLELHQHGAATFQARHGVFLRSFAELLASRSPFLSPNLSVEPANAP